MWYQLNYFCWKMLVEISLNLLINIIKRVNLWEGMYICHFRRSFCLTSSWMFGIVCEEPHLRSFATLIFLRLQVSKCNNPQSQRHAFYFIYKTPSLKTGKYEVKCKRNECFMSSQDEDFFYPSLTVRCWKLHPKTHCQRVDFG